MKKFVVMFGLLVVVGCSESPYVNYSMLKDELTAAERYAAGVDESSKTGKEITDDILNLYVTNSGPKDCKNSWFNPYTKKFECLADDFWEAPGRFVQKRDIGKTQGMGLKNGGEGE